MRVKDLAIWVIAALLALIPLYPAFITLTGVTPPGVSLLSHSATLALGAIVLLGMALLTPALLRAPRTFPPTTGPLIFWLLAALVSAALGFAPLAGLVFLAIFGLNISMHCAIARFVTGQDAARVYGAICVSAALSCLLAIAVTALRRPPELYAIAHGRAVGTFVLPGELAGYLIVVLPLAFELVRSAREPWLRATAACTLVFGLPAFILTFSRAGWIGLAASAACYAAWRSHAGRRYGVVIVAAGVLAVLAAFNVRHNPAENFTRISIWQAAIEMIRRFPLLGVGPFDFSRIYPLVRVPGGEPQAFHAHDVVLTLFAETGLLGVLAMLWAWCVFARTLVQRLARTPVNAPVALAIAAGLAGTWVQGLIDTVSVVIFGVWLPAMALALAAAAPRKERS